MEMWIVPKKKSLEQRSHFGSHSQTDGMWKPREWLIRVRQNSQCSSIQGQAEKDAKIETKRLSFLLIHSEMNRKEKWQKRGQEVQGHRNQATVDLIKRTS